MKDLLNTWPARAGIVALAVLLVALGAFAMGGSQEKSKVTTAPGEKSQPQGEVQPGEQGSELPELPTGTTATTATKGKKSSTTAQGGKSAPKSAEFLKTGIDLKDIKIGIIAPTGDPGAAVGVATSAEDYGRIARAMSQEINASGGFAGRKILPVVVELDDSDQGQANQTRLQNEACVQLTEDEKVFMVITYSRLTFFAFACYAQHRTPLLSMIAPGDKSFYDQYSPWLLPPMGMTSQGMAKLLPKALAEQGGLSKNMGIVAYDLPEYKSNAEDVLIPEIGARGGKVVDKIYLPGEYDAFTAAITTGTLRFGGANLSPVVFFAPGGAAWLLFSSQADKQLYYPKYGISTFDSPEFMQGKVPDSQIVNAFGAGYMPGADVQDSVLPPTAKEKDCWTRVNKRAGTAYATRRISSGNGFAALVVCETFFQTQRALAGAAGQALAADQVRGLFVGLGAGYSPVQFNDSKFAAGRPHGISSYARLAYDTACACFRYKTGWLDL